LLSIQLTPDAFAYDNGDWQYWNTESIEGNINEKWKIKLEEEFRFGDEAGEFYYHHSDLGLSYKCYEWLKLGLNYRQVYEKKNRDWKQENRPHLNGTVKWALADFKFTDRSRLEYRIREGKDDALRYRNKLTIKFPFKWTKFNIQPYLADEVFVDFDQGELNRNRLYVGTGCKLIKYLKADVFYLWQSSKSSDSWVDYNIVGTKLNIVF
jgi:hypothetical protein